MLDGFELDVNEFLSSRSEWHYFWLGAFVGWIARSLIRILSVWL